MPKIEKTASGKWKTRVFLGTDANGKKHHKQFTHEDKRLLKLIVAEFEQTHREYQESSIFRICLDKYIAQRDGLISPSTIRVYRSAQNVLNTNYPQFCALTLSSIGRNDIQKVINDMVRRGRSGKYIKNIHGIISGVLIENNYVSPKVTLPSGKAREVHEPSKEDIQATLAAARGTSMEIPILLGIHGLRRGEICALRYPEDFDGNIIHVHHAMVYGYKDELVEKDTKTDMSDRYVPISDECLRLISEQGYVTQKTLAAISNGFAKLLKRNDIPKYRFHDLRHFFASYLHDQGFTDAQIMKLGGWKTDSVMKRIYRYALPDEKTNDRIQSIMNDLTG